MHAELRTMQTEGQEHREGHTSMFQRLRACLGKECTQDGAQVCAEEGTELAGDLTVLCEAAPPGKNTPSPQSSLSWFEWLKTKMWRNPEGSQRTKDTLQNQNQLLEQERTFSQIIQARKQ